MPETSYSPSFTPYQNWSVRQAPVPTSTHNLAGSIAASGSIQSSLIVTAGFSQISVGLTSSNAGTLSVQRYLDAGGAVAQGVAIAVPLVANTPANLDVMDGKSFSSFKITVTNSVASTATLSNVAVLLQAADLEGSNNASDGSTTITTGGTAQTLFGGVIPTNGFAVYNPDPANDLWISDTTTAAINGLGSVRIAPNGGSYETPATYRPIGAVSIVGAAAGQKITARRW